LKDKVRNIAIDRIAYLSNTLLSLVFPLRCVICKETVPPLATDPICGECKKGLPLNFGENCRSCGRPIAGDTSDGIEMLCGDCRADPPPFDRTVYPLHYEEKTKDLIYHFKFLGKQGLASTLANIMSAKLHREMEMNRFDMIIPVPLHPARLYTRGYNQSYLLARDIGNTFSIPVEHDIVIRIKDTPPQSTLTRKERIKNLKKAFIVEDVARIQGKEALLVDDVMTTGSTLREVSKTMKNAGAKSVACAVAARA